MIWIMKKLFLALCAVSMCAVGTVWAAEVKNFQGIAEFHGHRLFIHLKDGKHEVEVGSATLMSDPAGKKIGLKNMKNGDRLIVTGEDVPGSTSGTAIMIHAESIHEQRAPSVEKKPTIQSVPKLKPAPKTKMKIKIKPKPVPKHKKTTTVKTKKK